MRRRCGSRRPAVPVTGGTVAGVLCLVPCFLLCVKDFWAGVHTCDIWSGHKHKRCGGGGGGRIHIVHVFVKHGFQGIENRG